VRLTSAGYPRLAAVALAFCLIVVLGLLTGSRETAHAARSTSIPMRISFDGAGRSRKVCFPTSQCKSAVITASWHREWIVDVAPGSSGHLKPPEIEDLYTDIALWKDRGPCDVTYKGTARDAEQAPGPTNVGGQLSIVTSVPLTEGTGGQSGGPNPLGKPPSCIGVEISNGGGPVPKAIQDALLATATFGSYQAWTRGGGGLAQSRVVNDSYTGLSSAAATAGTGTWDWAGALSVCTGGCLKSATTGPELAFWARYVAYVLAKFGNLKVTPGIIPPGDIDATLDGRVSVQTGARTTSSSAGGAAKAVLLATIHQRFARRRSTVPRPVSTPNGRQILAGLTRPATFIAQIRVTPSRGKPVSDTYTFRLVPVPPDRSTTPAPPPSPAPASGTIKSVAFGGSPANPSFVVHGTNLGKLPKHDPAGHLSGLNGCPTVAGDTGFDFGTNLYLAVPMKNWSGGRYRPSLNETDCLDLVVTKFTPTEVAFHFGPFYTKYPAQFSLDDGDAVEVGVNGAVKSVHVKYGATVTG